jgi:aspartyl-tRNA(Asn)/glutamyl-tRNA(Gln) amidotransferase subunit A
MNYQNIAALQAGLLTNTISCTQVVQLFLKTIEDKKNLNAFIEVFDTEALQTAHSIDEKIKAKKPLGKLFGVVIGLKDNICYKNHLVTASSKILSGFESLYSATVVEKLIAEDAIIIGRLNCDEFAMGSSNETSFYGKVLNEIDQTRTPGGSSGGSAVAVQANLCHVSLGSDTGGSIRQPASFCGVYGLKPTYGRVSRYGLIAFASSFDQIGPFANNLEDLALIYETIAGKDKHDATCLQNEVAPIDFTHLPKAKIAYFKEAIETEGLNEEVKNAFFDLKSKLEQQGHTFEAVEFPELDYLIPTYYVLSTAEASSNLSRFDGVHYGYRSPNAKNMDEVYTKSRTEGFGKEVKNRIMLGTFVLSAGYYDAYYTKAQKVRRILKEKVSTMYRQYDFIISPTAPNPAFKFGEKTQDPVAMYLEDIYTVLANLVGNPAISLPLYQTKTGLPIGIQLMANDLEENKLISFSKQISL